MHYLYHILIWTTAYKWSIGFQLHIVMNIRPGFENCYPNYSTHGSSEQQCNHSGISNTQEQPSGLSVTATTDEKTNLQKMSYLRNNHHPLFVCITQTTLPPFYTHTHHTYAHTRSKRLTSQLLPAPHCPRLQPKPSLCIRIKEWPHIMNKRTEKCSSAV